MKIKNVGFLLCILLLVSCSKNNPVDTLNKEEAKYKSLSKTGRGIRTQGELLIKNMTQNNIVISGLACSKVYGDSLNGKIYYIDGYSSFSATKSPGNEYKIGHLFVYGEGDDDIAYGDYLITITMAEYSESFEIGYRDCKYFLNSDNYDYYDINIEVEWDNGQGELDFIVTKAVRHEEEDVKNTSYEIRDYCGKSGSNDISDFVNDYKDPVTSVTISGPGSLYENEEGKFTAVTQPTKRKLEIYYQWYYRNPGRSGGGRPGDWTEMPNGEGYDKKSVTWKDTEDFELKVVVTDKRYNDAQFEDTHYVYVDEL